MLWFKNEDRLIGETESFDIIKTNDKYASVRWIKSNGIKEMLFSGYYENCVASLGYIQANIVKEEDTVIDLSAFNELTHTLPSTKVYDKMADETPFSYETKSIATPSEEEIIAYLNNNDKYMTYESYLENKRKNDVEKFVDKKTIISAPKELADKLHEYRRANGWNMLGTAKALGVEQSTVWGWFKGTNIPRFKKHRDLLAKTLNVRFEKDM